MLNVPDSCLVGSYGVSEPRSCILKIMLLHIKNYATGYVNNRRYSSGRNAVKSSYNLLGNILPILQEAVISVKSSKKGIY